MIESSDTQFMEWKNDAESDCPAYGCFRLVSLEQLAPDRTILHGDRPNTYGAQYDHFINGPVTVKAGTMGACFRTGQVPAAFDATDGSPATGDLWGPRSGTWLLKKNTGGFRIRGITNTTNSFALVEAAPMLSFVGKTDAAISKGATGTVSIYWGALGSETDTTQNFDSVLTRFGDVGASKWVRCGWDAWNNGWEIVMAEC